MNRRRQDIAVCNAVYLDIAVCNVCKCNAVYFTATLPPDRVMLSSEKFGKYVFINGVNLGLELHTWCRCPIAFISSPQNGAFKTHQVE